MRIVLAQTITNNYANKDTTNSVGFQNDLVLFRKTDELLNVT